MLKFLKYLLVFVVVICLFFGVNAISAAQNDLSSQETTTISETPQKNSDGDIVVLDGKGESKGNSATAVILAGGFVLVCFVLVIDGVVTFIRNSKKNWDDKLM